MSINANPPSDRDLEAENELLAVQAYEFDNRISYLEDKVAELREMIHRYQHLFESLGLVSSTIDVCPSESSV